MESTISTDLLSSSTRIVLGNMGKIEKHSSGKWRAYRVSHYPNFLSGSYYRLVSEDGKVCEFDSATEAFNDVFTKEEQQ